MLMQEPLPTTLGFPMFPYSNVGSMRNTGWEFGITYRKAWSDFNFTASANISTYKNEVTSLGNGDAIYGHAFDNVTVLTKTEVGQPVGYFMDMLLMVFSRMRSKWKVVRKENRPNREIFDSKTLIVMMY